MLSPFTANQTLGRAWPFSKNQEQQQQQVGQFSSPVEQLIMNPFGNMGLSQSPASWSALRQLGIASLLSSDLIESPVSSFALCALVSSYLTRCSNNRHPLPDACLPAYPTLPRPTPPPPAPTHPARPTTTSSASFLGCP